MIRTIVLLTDFGHKDHYVGVMKGVISGIAKEVQVIDLCHEVSPQDVRSAAYLLGVSYRYFPSQTIFLCVVDPTVGTERRLIAAQLGNYYFLAPDNGTLTMVLDREEKKRVVQITNPIYRLARVSSTFHGRDILSPAAAHLARGLALTKLGEGIKGPLITLQGQVPKRGKQFLEGEIFYIDHFGNLITNLHSDLLHPTKNCEVTVRNKKIQEIGVCYAEVNKGELVAVVASSDFLEIAVNQGNAQKRLHAKIGDPVRVRWK